MHEEQGLLQRQQTAQTKKVADAGKRTVDVLFSFFFLPSSVWNHRMVWNHHMHREALSSAQ
jgi:hypothetical protein